MITPKEKRFIRYWEEQRKGGKWSFILLYTICFTFLCTVSPLLAGIVLDLYNFLDLPNWGLFSILGFIAISCFTISYYYWNKNEAKWKALTQRQPTTR